MSYRLLTIIVVLFVPIAFQSCLTDAGTCNLEKSEQVFRSKQAQYYPKVLQNIKLYNQLKTFLLIQADTIFSYNQEKKIAVTTDDKTEWKALDHLTEITLHNYGKGNMKDQLPPFIYPQFMYIYQQLKIKAEFSVSLTRDNIIVINLNNPANFNHDDIGVVHRLSWNEHTKNLTEDNTLAALQRDTILADNARYTVFVHCYQGW